MESRHFADPQTIDAKKTVDSVSGAKHFKLSGRVRPLIILRGGKEDGTWRAQSHQSILIERQFLRSIVELLEFCVEPIGKMIVDRFDRLAGFAAAWSAAAATGLVRKRHRDAFIEGRGKQRGLSVSRMA